MNWLLQSTQLNVSSVYTWLGSFSGVCWVSDPAEYLMESWTANYRTAMVFEPGGVTP